LKVQGLPTSAITKRRIILHPFCKENAWKCSLFSPVGISERPGLLIAVLKNVNEVEWLTGIAVGGEGEVS